ncbi:MAG: CsgG/HfaB family protein [bacterium]
MKFLHYMTCLFFVCVVCFCIADSAEQNSSEPSSEKFKPPPGSEAQAEKGALAVLDIEMQGIAESAQKALSDLFRSELMKTGKYEVMERGKMDDIMKEQGFQQSGACTDEACLIEMGQILGVDGMVAGSIGKLGKLTLINIRKISIETGKIDKTVSQECQCQEENIPLALKIVAGKLAGRDVTKELARLDEEIKSTTAQKKMDEQEKREAEAEALAKAQKKGIPGAAIITASVLLVGAAGGGIYFLMSGKDGDETPPDVTGDGPLKEPPIPSN